VSNTDHEKLGLNSNVLYDSAQTETKHTNFVRISTQLFQLSTSI